MNEALVTENIGLVPFVVRKYFRPQSDFEEWVAVGNIGLVRAAKTFKSNQNAAFSTFATRCICNEINNMILTNNREKRTLKEGFVYLDHVDGDKETNLYEVIPMGGTEKAIEDVENRILVEYLLSLLKNEREKQLLILYFGLNGSKEMTCEEIGKQMGCTRTRVSQIIRKSLEHIRRRAGRHLESA
jgi:RNA polymerase sporulation-specific sigma factor